MIQIAMLYSEEHKTGARAAIKTIYYFYIEMRKQFHAAEAIRLRPKQRPLPPRRNKGTGYPKSGGDQGSKPSGTRRPKADIRVRNPMDRKPRAAIRAKKTYGDRPQGEGYQGNRKTYGDKPQGERAIRARNLMATVRRAKAIRATVPMAISRRERAIRARNPIGDKPQGGYQGNRSYGDKPQGDGLSGQSLLRR